MARRLLMVVTAGAVVTLSACAADRFSADEVASAAEDALAEKVGTRPEISCPDPLPKEEGASTRCVLTAGKDPEIEYGVTVRVTDVDDRTSIAVEVDDAPLEEKDDG